jgi:RNA polymerase-binding transcription factor DksA
MSIKGTIREIKKFEKILRKKQTDKCKRVGHKRGNGAFSGYSYCRTCGAQIANEQFGRTA